MIGFLIFIHVLVSIILVVSILLQSSKGGGLAGMFGGGGGMGVFGARGAATFLSKVTMYMAITFGVTSISIAFLSAKMNQTPRSMVQEVLENQEATPSDILPIAPGATDQQQETAPLPSDDE